MAASLKDADALLLVPDPDSEHGWCLAVLEPQGWFDQSAQVIDGHYDIVSRHDTQAAAAEALLAEVKR